MIRASTFLFFTFFCLVLGQYDPLFDNGAALAARDMFTPTVTFNDPIKRNQYDPHKGSATRRRRSAASPVPEPPVCIPSNLENCNHQSQGSDGPTPYTIEVHDKKMGVQLPSGNVYQDSGHVNYKAIACDQYKYGQSYKTNQNDWTMSSFGTHFESLNNQPSGYYIGKSFYDFSGAATTYPDGYCVVWIQLSQYNQHWGEGGQNPACYDCQCPAPTVATKQTQLTQPGTVAAYEQCGGVDYTGAITCTSGYSCVYQNDYFWQCLKE